MICPHCNREQKGNDRTVCMFCKKNLHASEVEAPGNHYESPDNALSEASVRADAGDVEACYRLGVMYYQGNGCARNLPLAVDYFEKAAQADLAEACYALALCQLQGKGTRQDIRRALENLSAAAQHKHAKAIKLLQDIKESIRNSTKDKVSLCTDTDQIGDEQCIEVIRFLPDDSANTCPNDQYELTRCKGYLAYHTLDPLQRTGYLHLPLLRCSTCHTWYISRSTLHLLEKSEFDISGLDIVGSKDYPRSDVMAEMHAPPVPEPEEIKVKSKKKSSQASRRSSNRRGKKNRQHLAIKVAACDGGRAENNFGYKGLCSNAFYQLHKKHVDTPWCASRKNHCRDWSKDQLENNEYPCLECHLLVDWKLGSAADGANDSSGHRIAGDREGSLALLTAIQPGNSELERRVFAIFQISSHSGLQDGEICAEPDRRLELMLDEPVLFWDHYPVLDQDNPRWGSVFYRNMQNDQVKSVLDQAITQVQDPERKEIALQLRATLDDAAEVVKPG